MKPGTYTATLYQGELEAGTGEVTVSAGEKASLDLESSLDLPETVWAIGAVDGTPAGVRKNASYIFNRLMIISSCLTRT